MHIHGGACVCGVGGGGGGEKGTLTQILGRRLVFWAFIESRVFLMI